LNQVMVNCRARQARTAFIAANRRRPSIPQRSRWTPTIIPNHSGTTRTTIGTAGGGFDSDHFYSTDRPGF